MRYLVNKLLRSWRFFSLFILDIYVRLKNIRSPHNTMPKKNTTPNNISYEHDHNVLTVIGNYKYVYLS